MRDNRVGLCLGGGGVTGAMYEVGCLAALEDFFEDFRASDFDVFVGTSSGATVAMVLAGGVSATRMYRALLDPADDFFPLGRQHLLRLHGREWVRVVSSSVRAARHFISSAASRPRDLDLWHELDRLWDSLPAGCFTLEAYEEFIAAFMVRRQIPERFADLDRPLYLVANDLDRGQRVVFGGEQLAHVRISRAICAASAIPIVFAPVRIDDRDYIDGGMGDVAHADLALGAGCQLVLIINPMVPVRSDPNARDVPTGHGPSRRVRDKGLIWVSSQAWRLRSEQRLQDGLSRYRAEHPGRELFLLEPDPDDATMFMYSPMNFAARRTILEDGYVRTIKRLRADGSDLRAALERAGLRKKPAAV